MLFNNKFMKEKKTLIGKNNISKLFFELKI